MASTTTTTTSFPDWVILDRCVFYKDDGSFPDGNSTVALGTNSKGDQFRAWFQLAAPPRVSRLYVQPVSGDKDFNFHVVAAHSDVVLLQMSYNIPMPHEGITEMVDHILYRAGGSQPSLDLLPPIGDTIAEFLAWVEKEGFRLTAQRLRRSQGLDIGVVRRGKEYAVAELEITCLEAPPKLHVLFTSRSSRWEVKQPLIIGKEDLNLQKILWYWDTDKVVTFGSYLCWVDKCLGILFCDVFNEIPQLQYLELPAELPGLSHMYHSRLCVDAHQAVGITKDGVMKFVNVARGDGKLFGPFVPASGFTLTSWTLRTTETNGMAWEEDAVVTADELWDLDEFKHLPHNVLKFPFVNMDDPSVIHFVLTQDLSGGNYDKTWLVAVDMSNKMVKSSFIYVNLEEDPSREEAEFAEEKEWVFDSFLPTEFTKYLNMNGTRTGLLQAGSEHVPVGVPIPGKKRKFMEGS